MIERFRNRREAGQWLATRLSDHAGETGGLILALPRGGVPVAFEVAQALRMPLDVCLVRKLGVPGQEELALGAIAAGGVRVLNSEVIDSLGLSAGVIDLVAEKELLELRRRERVYRGDKPGVNPQGRTAILVDDGIATGSTMAAAVTAARQRGAARIIVATPVAAFSAVKMLRGMADEFVALITPVELYGVGRWYDDFSQVTDQAVRELLARADLSGPRDDPRPERESSHVKRTS